MADELLSRLDTLELNPDDVELFYDFCYLKYKECKTALSKLLSKITLYVKQLPPRDDTLSLHHELVTICCDYYMYDLYYKVDHAEKVYRSMITTYEKIRQDEMSVMKQYRQMARVFSEKFPEFKHYIYAMVLYVHATLLCGWDFKKMQNKRMKIERENSIKPIELMDKFDPQRYTLEHMIKDDSIPNSIEFDPTETYFNPDTYIQSLVLYPSDYINYLKIRDELDGVRDIKRFKIERPSRELGVYIFILILELMSDAGLLLFYEAVKLNRVLRSEVIRAIRKRTIFSWVEYKMFTSLSFLTRDYDWKLTSLQIGDNIKQSINLDFIINSFPNLKVLAIDTPSIVTLKTCVDKGLYNLKCLRMILDPSLSDCQEIYKWIMERCPSLEKLCFIGMDKYYTPKLFVRHIQSETIDINSRLRYICMEPQLCRRLQLDCVLCLNCLFDMHRVAVLNHKKQRNFVKIKELHNFKLREYYDTDNVAMSADDGNTAIQNLRVAGIVTLHRATDGMCTCPPGLFDFLKESFIV